MLTELERKVQPGLLQTLSTAQCQQKAVERSREGVGGKMKQLLGLEIGGKWHHSPQSTAARKCKSGNL